MLAIAPRRLLYVLLAFLGLAGVALAQHPGAVTGAVVRPDGLPVPNAMVTVYGNGATLHSRTDADGAFRLLGVPAGIYDLYASQDVDPSVCGSRFVSDVVVASGKESPVEVTMSPETHMHCDQVGLLYSAPLIATDPFTSVTYTYVGVNPYGPGQGEGVVRRR